MVVALMLAAVSVVILVVCLQHARSEGWKAPGLRSLKRKRTLLAPAPEDMPPTGLAPLVPTPRAIASEFARSRSTSEDSGRSSRRKMRTRCRFMAGSSQSSKPVRSCSSVWLCTNCMSPGRKSMSR